MALNIKKLFPPEHPDTSFWSTSDEKSIKKIESAVSDGGGLPVGKRSISHSLYRKLKRGKSEKDCLRKLNAL